MKADILIIVDDLDIIKRYMHKMKDALETIQPMPKVICTSTNDFKSDSEIRSCGKALIIIDQTTALRGTVLKACMSKLAEKKIHSSKTLILQLGDEEYTCESIIGNISVVKIIDLMDISSWWPRVLRFLFRKSLFRFNKRSMDFMVLNISSYSSYAKKQTELLEKIFETADLGREMKEEESDCIVVVVNSVAKLSAEERSKLVDVQKRCRLRKQFLHILCTADTDCGAAFSEFGESVHNTDELLRLVLWVFMDLGVVHVVRKDLKTRLNQLCTRQFVLKISGAVLKILGAILWICFGIPMMLTIDIVGLAIIVTVLGIIIAVALILIALILVVSIKKGKMIEFNKK